MNAEYIEIPLVTAIIPTFNRSHILFRAINSVLNQSYRNIEIIVVDDGSTDETRATVEDIGGLAHNVKYLQKSNGGCASARNAGLRIAKGKFIAFLDSDDEWVPSAIESMVRIIQESCAELVYSPSIEVYENCEEEINYPVASTHPEMLAKAHFMDTNLRNGAYLFSRSACKKVGWVDEELKFNEDSDYVQRLAIHCRAVYLPKPTIRVYNHENRKSQNRIEIYKALLKSSERNLLENPGFAAQLGKDADKRIFQIKAQLVETLIMGDHFDEANSIAKEINGGLRLNVKLALLTGNNALLKQEYLIRGHLRSIMKTLNQVFRAINQGLGVFSL
jgi:glycosyltransferase involved in cell wall biosynthesis